MLALMRGYVCDLNGHLSSVFEVAQFTAIRHTRKHVVNRIAVVRVLKRVCSKGKVILKLWVEYLLGKREWRYYSILPLDEVTGVLEGIV